MMGGKIKLKTDVERGSSTSGKKRNARQRQQRLEGEWMGQLTVQIT
jgi:hypothetical protein